jgi:hypothetical protein
MQRIIFFQLLLMLFLASPTLLALSSKPIARREKRLASSLPDFSGLTWAGEDRFLAVHDTKNPDEKSARE